MFDCVTEPPPPGLQTRTGEASFDGPNCAAREAARASCSVAACWPSTWIPEPVSLCVPSCVVAARLPAVAEESALFD